MELSSIQHIDPGQLADIEADIFLTTLGFESRCTSVARLLEKHQCRKIALSRTDHIKEHSYQENNAYYTGQGFEIVPVESKVPDMEALFGAYTRENIRVIIDCTSMSPRWYYKFFSWFSEKQDGFLEATIRIAYTMPAFGDHEQIRKVKSVKNFIKTESEGKGKKKTALILGLGHEKNTCETIYNKINPDLLYLFYADPPADRKFVEKIFVNNHALINSTSIRNLIAYPLRNGQMIYQTLIDAILPLRNEYSVILVPQGPKFFSVVAQLVHLGYPDIQLSYPKYKKPPAVDQYPSDEPVVLDVLFEGEE
ncbi:MAG: hypothetical protein ABFS28_01870 [Bacteroidota bacterium]